MASGSWVSECQLIPPSYIYFPHLLKPFHVVIEVMKKTLQNANLILIIATISCVQALIVFKIIIQPFGCNLAAVVLYLFAV